MRVLLMRWLLRLLPLLIILAALVTGQSQTRRRRQDQYDTGQPDNEQPQAISPYILYGPHGYRTFPHSRCQEVPTVDVSLDEIEGDWFLIEYVNSHDGKPIGAHTPYLCPEARITIDPMTGEKRMNVSQMSLEWPALFLDTVEWIQHHNKTGVFFHEENIFSLWTMKVMELNPQSHMVIFLCIDYTIWPGWNHRGVYVLSRHTKLQEKIKRKLSDKAHRRMRMDFDRRVNTTSCDPDEWLPNARLRWHPHKKINRDLYRAPIHPYMSRKHRRNLKGLD